MLLKQNKIKYLKKQKLIFKGKNFIYFNNKFLTLYNNFGSFFLNFKQYISEIKLLNNEIILILKNKNDLLFILTFLKKHYKYQFKQLVDICAIDYYLYNVNNRFEINYILLSLKYKTRLRIKFLCNEKTIISSVSQIFSSAN